MAVTINASTSAGLISTADTSGVLQLQTANTTAVTVNANQTVSLAVGTANGVTYLNGSKVLTSGSALTFDGTNFSVVGGNATINRSTNTSRLTLGGSPSANWEGDIQFVTSNTQTNWRVSSNQVASGAFTITPSTAGGGSTFTSPAVLIDSSSNVGIGTTSPAQKLHCLADTSSALFQGGTLGGITFLKTGQTGMQLFSDATGTLKIYDNNAGAAVLAMVNQNLGVGTTSPINNGGYGGFSLNGTSGALLSLMTNGTESSRIASLGDLTSIQCKASTGYITFVQGVSGGTERARITSAGELIVGKTVNTFATAGIVLNVDNNKYSTFTRNGGGLADFNRTGDDGNLIAFWQDGTQEGNITVTGTTVSYNGGHLSRYAQTTTPKDDSIVKGTVLSNLDEMSVYTKDGQPVANEQLNKVKVSDTEGDANVAGVFVSWSHDEEHNVDEINMAMTGDMIIRIAQGVTVVRGDLLMSAGDGTAKPQGDDIIRSKTVAKVTSNHVTCTYADGSYCVPCVLMAC